MQLLKFSRLIVPVALACFGGEAAAGNCKIEKQAELALTYANGMAAVEAKIDGKTVVMGIDTGAQTLVTPETAEKLRLLPALHRTMLRGTTTVTIADQVTIRDFEFGGDHFRWKDVTKVSLPKPAQLDLRFKAAGGIIGMDILSKYDFEVDYPRSKLALYKVNGCATVPPPDYEDIRVIPFRFNEQRNILFPVDLDGKKITALLDTGTALHMITHAGIRKAGVTEAQLKADPQIESAGVGNVSRKHPIHKFNSLGIGGTAQPNVLFGVLPRPLSEADALIGQLYFFTRRFRISSATRTLYVENRQALLSAQAPGSPPLLPPAGSLKTTTLADVCKSSAALRLQNFCEHGGGVPAAALGGPLPFQAAPATPPAWAATAAAAPVMPAAPEPSRQTSNAPLPQPSRERQMSAEGYIGTGVLGISKECGKAMGVPSGTGVLVRGFATGSTGEKAGLRRGDIVTALNGQPVAGASSFLEAIRKTPPGQKVKLAVWRHKQESGFEAEAADSRSRPADELTQEGRAAYQIEAGEAVLAMILEAGCAQERAISLIFLGGVYNRRAGAGGSPDDYEQAIKYLEDGLARLGFGKSPANWAAGQAQLGTAYRLRKAGGRSDNIEKAIKAYEESILVRQNFVARNDRGYALMGLGLALLSRGQERRSENIERAIGCFHLAKQAFDTKVNAKDWVEVNRALASAYLERSEGEPQQNIGDAIQALETAADALGPGEEESTEKSAVLAQLTELKAKRSNAP